MDPIQPISPAIQNLPAVEPVHRRVDPDEQRREQERRERERRRRERGGSEPEPPEEDDGRPHIDVSV
jgi:hypothetical protein